MSNVISFRLNEDELKQLEEIRKDDESLNQVAARVVREKLGLSNVNNTSTFCKQTLLDLINDVVDEKLKLLTTLEKNNSELLSNNSSELETEVVPTNDESYIEETTVESEDEKWVDGKLIDLDKPVSDAVVSKEVGIDNSGTLKNFKTNPKYKAASVKNAKIYADYKEKFVYLEDTDSHYRILARK